jgi:hypothetical protein
MIQKQKILFYSSTFSLFARKKKYQKERAAVHLVQYSAGLPCAVRKERVTSECRFTPPSRFSVLCCAARQREMALLTMLS